MSIRTSAKKVAIAAVMVAPLLLAACGSDNDEDTATSSTTTTSTSPSTTTSDEETTEEVTEEVTEEETVEETVEDAAAEPAGQPAPEATVASEPAPQQVMPSEVITYEELPPVQGGQPASPEDSAAIESLIRGSLAPTTVRSMLQYVPQNTCNRVIEAAGGAAALDFSQIPDIPLNQIPGANTGTVDSISDIVVQGDTASAWVVASGNGQTDSATQRFLREDGRWKFCD
ncbi:hypothetical protein CFAEC_09110 [Corynebacterium faecale]|uniref:hypothetical protein n=1 Tax=Corynebacterium faecale TaxID=1758466 RepID=UPI0025B293F1|nr:hypothetical protein [Corynebacterium faecale]WJY92639.1 hypothetical protein CFAEC_09110 [Corynebacterium faecale]